MLSLIFQSLVAVATFSSPIVPNEQGAETKEKVILVDLQVNSPEEAKKCYSTSFDKKRVELVVESDDPIANLADFGIDEDPLQGPGCFMPDTKIIFQNYTYVLSLYCTSVKKYKNSGPYTPSSVALTNDLEMTESILSYVAKMRKTYFGSGINSQLASKFDKREPLPADEKIDDNFLYNNDDDNDDKEIEKEAEDKEGWFEQKNDPELDRDDTPDPQPE